MSNLIFIFTLIVFSFSNAQNMFFHLLPGFGTPFTWVGLGVDSNWTTPENWNTSVVPGASDIATFNGSCIANCDPTINVSISIRGFDIKATYSGTITQATGQSITIGSAGWVQAGGTFSGSDSNITFNASVLSLSNTASFISTSGETYFDLTNGASLDVVTVPALSSLVFPNNSTQRFRLQGDCGGIQYRIVSPQKISFYNLMTTAYGVGCGTPRFNAPAGGVEIRNDYTHTGSAMSANGNFDLFGHMTLATGIDENSNWNVIGNISKNYSGPGSAGRLIVNKTGGASFSPINGSQTFGARAFELVSGEFTFPQTFAMVWTSSSSSVHFRIDSGTIANVPTNSSIAIETWGACGGITKGFDVDGIFNFENLSLIGNYTGCSQASMNLAGGDVLVVKKNFSLGHSFAANFDISVEGDYSTVGSPNGSMAVTLVNGLTASWSQAQVGTVNGLVSVSKPGLTTTALTNLSLTSSGQSLNISNGVVDLSGRNLAINNNLTVGANAKLLCQGGSVSAFSWTINGEVSCASSIGVTWTGLAGDNLWSSPGNWTNSTVPGVNDVAIFNGVCAGLNCNVQTDANVSIRGISILSGYNGTITQSAGHTFTIGAAGYSQAAGTFVGGNSPITMDGVFVLSGGSFTSTSSNWTHSSNITVSGAPTFSHNNGTIVFTGTYGVNSITPGSANFNNVTLSGFQQNQNLNAGTMIVLGTLTLSDGDAIYGSVENGTIEVRNGIVLSAFGKQGSALLRINGTVDQVLAGIASAKLPHVQINKPSGTLTMTGQINIYGSWTHTLGAVDAGTSTLTFNGQYGTNSISPGTMSYWNVTFTGFQQSQNLNAGTMVVAGSLTLGDTDPYSGSVNNGTIEMRGGLVLSSYGKSGSVLVLVNGTTDQSISGLVTARVPNLQINKPSGTLTLSGQINIYGNWTYTAGAVDAGTSTLTFNGNYQSNSIIPGSATYANVIFRGAQQAQNLNAGTMIVSGTLTLSDDDSNPGSLNNGNVEVKGNLVLSSSGKLGSALLILNGTVDQSITAVTSARGPSIQINKSSGILSLSGQINIYGNWTHTAGIVNAGTSTLTFNGNYQSNSIVPGSVTYANITFAGGQQNQNLNAGTMIVSGTLTLSDSDFNPGSINNGTIQAQGNVVVSSYGKLGAVNFEMNGSVSRDLTWTAGAFLTSTISMAKSGGASVILQSNANFSTTGRDLNVTSGVLDLNAYDLSVNDTLTVSATGVLRCNGGEFVAGSLSNSGTVNCPGYSTYDFNWTGAGGNPNWSTDGNWQGGLAPSANDIVFFEDTYCGLNCNSTIDTSASVKGMYLSSLFTGTITQGLGNTLTVGTRGYSQLNGTFVGSNANITIALNSASKSFSLTGGSFTSTSAIFQVGFLSGAGGHASRDTFIVGPAAVFNHSNGTVRLACYEATSGMTLCRINAPSGLSLRHLSTYATNNYGGGVAVTAGQTVVVNGNLTVESGAIRDLETGYFDVHGDLSINSGGSNLWKPGIIRLVGATDQTYTLTGTDCTARIEINKPSGNVLPGSASGRICSLRVLAGSFTAPTGTLYLGVSGHAIRAHIAVLNLAAPNQFIDQGGVVDFNSVDVWSGGLNYSVITNGVLSLTNVITRGVNGFTSGHTINGGDKIMVTNSFEKASGRIAGSLELQGSASFAGMSDSAATFEFTGTAIQNVSGASAGSGNWVVNKTGGVLNLTSHLNLSRAGQNLNLASGEIRLNGFNLTVANNIQNLGVINRGLSPACGTISQGGSYSGNAAICP